MLFRSRLFSPTLVGESYRIFIEGLKSEVTKAAYSFALQKYMDHWKITNPDDLLKDKDNPKIIQDQIINYLIYLKNPPVSLRHATRSQYLAAIMTYYFLNDVILNKKKIYRYLGEEERPLENRAYSQEEIGKMLEVSDEKAKALILFLASTGVRIRAIIDLKLRDLMEVPKFGLYRVTVYADSKERYCTFTTPEATAAVKIYLDYRERYGEKLGSNSPVFRNQFDRNDPVSVHEVKSMELRATERLISRAIEKSGIRSVERTTELNAERGRIRKDVRLTSGFRKFFDTQLIYAKVEPQIKETLMGHSIGLDDHYFKPGEDYVLQEYLKAVNNLTMNEENRLKIRIQELAANNETNESIIRAKLNEKDNQIQALQRQVESVIQTLIESGQLKAIPKC